MAMAEPLATPNIKSLYSDAIRDMETYIMFRIAKRVVDLTPELTAKGRAPIKFSMGAPVVPPPQVLIDALKAAIDTPQLHTYSTPRGEAFFLEAVAQRMKARFGVTVDPKTEVCSLIGSKEGLSNMFRALISYRQNPQERDVIMVPDPGYASYVDAIQICGGIAAPMRLAPDNAFQPDFEDCLAELRQQGITPDRIKAMVISYPSNPIGVNCTFDYYKQAVAFCKRHNILLISDVAYADLYFPGEEPFHSVLEVEGAKDITIEFHSLSKPYAATGWRVGYAVGHRDAIDALERVKGTVDSGLFKCLQKAAAFALSSAECDAFVQRQNAIYKEAQALMVAGLTELGWPMAEQILPKATFYLWIPVPPRYATATDFANDLLETSGIVIVPGTAFGRYGEGYVRLSLVDTFDNMKEALRRMKEDGFTFQ